MLVMPHRMSIVSVHCPVALDCCIAVLSLRPMLLCVPTSAERPEYAQSGGTCRDMSGMFQAPQSPKSQAVLVDQLEVVFYECRCEDS